MNETPADGMDDIEYHVILERGSPSPLPALGEVLSGHLSIPPADAIARARYGHGLLAEGLDEQAAERLVLDLQAIGVSARPIESVHWLARPHGFKVHTLEFLEGALLAQLISEQSLIFEEDDVVGIHLYALTPQDEERAPTVARRRQRSRDREARKESRAIEVAVDCFSGETAAGSLLSPRGRTLLEAMRAMEEPHLEYYLTLYCMRQQGAVPVRIHKNDFDFSCLGKRRAEHSVDNFLILLDELVSHLPCLWDRDLVQEFLEELEPQRILYFKQEEAENHDRWMLQWVRLEKTSGDPL